MSRSFYPFISWHLVENGLQLPVGYRINRSSVELVEGDINFFQIGVYVYIASVHVAIFYANFVWSNWLLDELYLAEKSRATVLSIFYKAKPHQADRSGRSIYKPTAIIIRIVWSACWRGNYMLLRKNKCSVVVCSERSKTWVGDWLEWSSCVITEVLRSQNPNVWHSLGKGCVQKCYCRKYEGIRSSVSVSGNFVYLFRQFLCILGIHSLLSNFVLLGTCIFLQLMVIYQNKIKYCQSRVHRISYGSVGINTVPLLAFLE